MKESARKRVNESVCIRLMSISYVTRTTPINKTENISVKNTLIDQDGYHVHKIDPDCTQMVSLIKIEYFDIQCSFFD